MKLLRTLFVASGVLVLSAATLSAQAAQVTCKDGAKSKGGRGACSRAGPARPPRSFGSGGSRRASRCRTPATTMPAPTAAWCRR